jgi:hypothetical protein
VKAVCAKAGTAKKNNNAESNTWALGLIIWQLVYASQNITFSLYSKALCKN